MTNFVWRCRSQQLYRNIVVSLASASSQTIRDLQRIELRGRPYARPRQVLKLCLELGVSLPVFWYELWLCPSCMASILYCRWFLMHNQLGCPPTLFTLSYWSMTYIECTKGRERETLDSLYLYTSFFIFEISRRSWIQLTTQSNPPLFHISS